MLELHPVDCSKLLSCRSWVYSDSHAGIGSSGRIALIELHKTLCVYVYIWWCLSCVHAVHNFINSLFSLVRKKKRPRVSSNSSDSDSKRDTSFQCTAWKYCAVPPSGFQGGWCTDIVACVGSKVTQRCDSSISWQWTQSLLPRLTVSKWEYLLVADKVPLYPWPQRSGDTWKVDCDWRWGGAGDWHNAPNRSVWMSQNKVLCWSLSNTVADVCHIVKFKRIVWKPKAFIGWTELEQKVHVPVSKEQTHRQSNSNMCSPQELAKLERKLQLIFLNSPGSLGNWPFATPSSLSTFCFTNSVSFSLAKLVLGVWHNPHLQFTKPSYFTECISARPKM